MISVLCFCQHISAEKNSQMKQIALKQSINQFGLVT